MRSNGSLIEHGKHKFAFKRLLQELSDEESHHIELVQSKSPTPVELADEMDIRLVRAEGLRLFHPVHPSCLYTKRYVPLKLS